MAFSPLSVDPVRKLPAAPVYEPNDYFLVAASQTGTVLGTANAAKGNYLAGILVIPTSTSPGSVTLIDGTTSLTPLFAGGASSLSNLIPFYIPWYAYSQTGAWSVTTGAGLSVVAIGLFS